jgi:hypothetical protein
MLFAEALALPSKQRVGLYELSELHCGLCCSGKQLVAIACRLSHAAKGDNNNHHTTYPLEH